MTECKKTKKLEEKVKQAIHSLEQIKQLALSEQRIDAEHKCKEIALIIDQELKDLKK